VIKSDINSKNIISNLPTIFIEIQNYSGTEMIEYIIRLHQGNTSSCGLCSALATLSSEFFLVDNPFSILEIV